MAFFDDTEGKTLALIAVGYGALWVRVARTGRKPDAPWPKRSP